jgi:aldose 1-epimerase
MTGLGKKPFGSVNGIQVDLYTLTNSKGTTVTVTNYGGIVVSVSVPDREGRFADVILGHDSLDKYLRQSPFFGCLVGRYANRIGGARFTLEGRLFTLAANDGANCLHGGLKGFDKKVWKAREVERSDAVGVALGYLSADGEEGFPGNLDVTVTYWLTAADELTIEYSARTDAVTIVNLTNHCYWNLSGEGSGDILGHVVAINASRYTPAGPGLIPTGEIVPVKGTPLDFTKPAAIGARIDADFEQLKLAGGYDHNWVIDRNNPADIVFAASVHDPKSGRLMEISTTEPGIQFYSGNFLDGSITGKSGGAYGRRAGLCLETQAFPDSPNKPGFPSVVLRPGQTFASMTRHGFSVK